MGKKIKLIFYISLSCVLLFAVCEIYLFRVLSDYYRITAEKYNSIEKKVYFLKLSNFFKKSIDNYSDLGLYTADKNHKESLEMFDKAIELASKKDEVDASTIYYIYFYRALLIYEYFHNPTDEQLSKAINDNKFLSQAYPDSIAPKRLHLDILSSADKYQEVIKSADQLIKCHPQDPQKFFYIYNKAIAYYGLNELDEATEELEKMIILEPRSPIGYFYLKIAINVIQNEYKIATSFINKFKSEQKKYENEFEPMSYEILLMEALIDYENDNLKDAKEKVLESMRNFHVSDVHEMRSQIFKNEIMNKKLHNMFDNLE